MTTVLLILAACVVVAFGVSYLVKTLSYTEKEETLPVENYEVAKPTKTKRTYKPRAKKETTKK